MRTPIILLFCFTLVACSPDAQAPAVAYVPPSMPTIVAASEGIKKVATEAKLTRPIEISDLRETDHGPGRFFLCIRGVESIYPLVRTYAVFFDNDEFKGSRMSVILDECKNRNIARSLRRPSA
jgi:hypothetical protein